MEPKHVNLYKLIRDCPNFPKPGVLFRDITPVYSNYQALNYIADEFENILKGNSFDVVVGIESRGFVVATLLA
jgi:adenine phosphoribosyltransferase